jgi:hypothetical protein
MSSACDGDAIASSLTKKSRLRHRAIGALVIPVYRAAAIGLKTHLDEERLACESRETRLPLPAA